MSNLGNKIRILIAAIAIIAALYWAYDSLRLRTYSGTQNAFEVGSGSVIVTNPGSEPVPVVMRTVGRSATFRVESDDLNLHESARRQGSGRSSYYAVNFELPPGRSEIKVTRGSNVYFITDSNQRLEAVVNPTGVNGPTNIILFTAVVVLAGLFYISRTTGHRWVGVLRNRFAKQPTPSSAT